MEQVAKKNLLVGNVISDKMEKTVTVEVSRTVRHPRFHKIMRVKKMYKVHDENSVARVGDAVEFYEGRPVSKSKHMHLSRVVSAQEV